MNIVCLFAVCMLLLHRAAADMVGIYWYGICSYIIYTLPNIYNTQKWREMMDPIFYIII